MQLVQTDKAERLSENCEHVTGSEEVVAVPVGYGPSARRHDEVWPGEAAAAGSSGAVLQAGGLGR